MKHFTRSACLLLLLALIVTCLVLPVSAAGVGDYIYLNSSDTTYTINVSNCFTWMDIPSDQGDFTLSWDASGYMFCQPKSSLSKYIIVDDIGNPVSYNMSIDTMAYSLCYVLEFDITETDASGNRLLTYYFKETFSGNRTIGALAAGRVSFYNESLGVCQFINEGDGKYVFGISKQNDGSFAQRWYLVSHFANGKPVLKTAYDYTLTNGHYYGIDPCALGDHLLGEFHTVRAATCAKEGSEVSYCKYCQASVEKSIPRTEHNYNLVGVCPCGEVWLLPGDQSDSNYDPSAPNDNPGGAGNGGGGSNDGGAGGGEDKDSDGDSGGGLLAGIGNGIKNVGNTIAKWLGLDKVSDTVSGLIKTVVIVTFCCVVIGLIPVLTPFFKWVGKGIAFTWNSLKDLFKSIGNSVSKSSRSRSPKNKKRKKK